MPPDAPSPPLISWRDPLAALSLLTRLPLPIDHARTGARVGASAWAWPLVGAALGVVAGALALGALEIGLPAGVAAVLAMALLAALTGGLHEDGLSDCADGFWGAADRARRLEIMKDSRIGSFGAQALVLLLLLRWSALAALPAPALIPALALAEALSRAAILPVMRLPNARGSGLSALLGPPRGAVLALGLGLALGGALLLGVAGVVMALCAALGTVLVARLALARIGGQTGDVLGAVQQVSATAALAAAAALFTG